MQEEPKKLIFTNFIYTLVQAVLCFGSLVAGIVMVLSVRSDNELLDTIVCMYAFLFGGLFMRGLNSVSRWLVFIRMNRDELLYYQAMHPVRSRSVGSYRYLYRGTTSKSGFRMRERGPKFIVLSQSPLNYYESTHVDRLEDSCDLIKIRYSKRTFDRVFQMMRNEQKDILIKVFENDLWPK